MKSPKKAYNHCLFELRRDALIQYVKALPPACYKVGSGIDQATGHATSVFAFVGKTDVIEALKLIRDNRTVISAEAFLRRSRMVRERDERVYSIVEIAPLCMRTELDVEDDYSGYYRSAIDIRNAVEPLIELVPPQEERLLMEIEKEPVLTSHTWVRPSTLIGWLVGKHD